MVSSRAGNWTVRAVTLLLWGVAVASAAYWGLRLSSAAAKGSAVAPAARPVTAADPAALAALLGQSGAPASAPAAAPLASRFQLMGVVADRSQHGAALIAVDGRPARPYRVGSAIDEGLVLQSVQGRRASLGPSLDAPAAVTLELPTPVR